MPAAPALDQPTAELGDEARSRPQRGPLRVERLMGTVVGIDMRDPAVAPRAVDAVVARLEDIEARFSLFRPESQLSRLGRGELTVDGCDAEVRDVLRMCEDLRRDSDGVFDIGRHRTDGVLDPTGLVKGWAIEAAVAMFEAGGARNFAINAGGDVVARGEPEPGRAWRVGIRHPERADRVAAVLDVRDLAVATSGAYERGMHVVDPRTGHPAQGLLSMTVVGPSLTWADAYATTAFAMGRSGLAWVARHPGFGAFAITKDRRVVWTQLVDRLLAGVDSPRAQGH
jgi:thiamine biosynthesis lipoprotein